MAARIRKVSTAEPAVEAGALAASALSPIVGVGASAGGLEAFTPMLDALPVDTGMAFVLVQHMSPTRPSSPTGSAPPWAYQLASRENLPGRRFHCL